MITKNLSLDKVMFKSCTRDWTENVEAALFHFSLPLQSYILQQKLSLLPDVTHNGQGQCQNLSCKIL